MKIEELKHKFTKTDTGAEIIVLDNGAVIDAESEAMIQALHSRSTGGFRAHLKKLQGTGAGNFMNSFYVGYGHKSIGDCGSTTAFIEGVSLLAAKAIQDSPLYSGQEASTRYIDFSKQPFIDPTRSDEGRKLLEMQRNFYLEAQEPTRELLKEKHPRKKGEEEKTYEKAINARAFDITRSLLPAGAATNLAWHTNLRQAADRILFLRHHPLSEVAEVAIGLEKVLREHHQNSFTHKRYDATEAYQDEAAQACLYHDVNSPNEPLVDFSKVDREELEGFRKLLENRPAKTELPKYIGTAGIIKAEFQLDYGSFRDIQRHRAITQRMPLLTADLGFNQWYIENFPEKVAANLQNHLFRINEEIDSLAIAPETTQYFLPIGYNTSNKFTGDIPATVYMVETRDSRFVHPTLQRVAHEIGRQIERELKIPLHVDPEPNRFDIKRGTHDITQK